MEWKAYREAVLAAAREAGCEDAEVVYTANSREGVERTEGKIKSISCSAGATLRLRLLKNNRLGLASTQTPEDPEALVHEALANAEISEELEKVFFLGPQEYPKLEEPADPYADYTLETLLEKAVEAETLGMGLDARIEKNLVTALQHNYSELSITNTRGLCAERKRSTPVAVLGYILKEGEERKDGYEAVWGRRAAKLEACARKAVERATKRLGAKSIPAGSYPTLLTGEAFADLLSCFLGSFDAKTVLEGKSAWQDKIGQKVASPMFELTDDPFLPDNPQAFDGEGSPAQKTTVIREGVLRTFLHNLTTASQMGTETTSNAQRLSNGAISVGPTNLLVSPGEKTEPELYALAEEILLVEGLTGLHAGINPISGDFSLLADGALIRGGKRVCNVSQITVAGNFFELLQSIEALGDKLEPEGGDVQAPWVYLPAVQVAGGAHE